MRDLSLFDKRSPFAATGCDKALAESGMCGGVRSESCGCGWEPTIANLDPRFDAEPA